MRKETEIKGCRIVYDFTPGQGAPVVLMHGWGCRASTLESVARSVRELERPVINIDFPGFGDSAEPDAVWGVEQYTEAVEELLRREEVGPDVVLLGHSFGGRVGIVYASRNPVGKLILVDAAGVKPKRTLRYYVKVYSFKTKKQLLKLILGKKKAETYLDKLRAKAGSSDYRNSSPRMRAIMSRVVNEDLCHLMPKITAPTLLVWGTADTATPLADAKKMERLIPGAGLVAFEGAGHYSFLDRPGQFAAVLKSFLASQS
ncbi:MAG: alpha/beta hydrolase [Muribaculaceae bacterium]|nr:alpha/beta hydrolase [Muribaculaceae bacterium]